MRDRMGSLKDEMRGLREDHQPCEKTDDGVSTGVSDISNAPEGHQLHTGHETTAEGEFLPEVHMNTSASEERDKNPTSKDQVLSGGDGGNADQSDNNQDKDCILIDESDETITASHNDATVAIEFSSDGGEGADLKKDENTSYTRENNADLDDILVLVPSIADPSDPRSPAPFGQQHMRTQVSLEVVQCCSVATSPMTPPEGGHSFSFPSSFGKFGTVDAFTKDAELQVGQKVEFCSVATSPIPMTPKTPATTAFPELIGRETAPKDEKARESEVKWESAQQESFASSKSPEDNESEKTGALKFRTSKELSEACNSNVSPDTTTNSTASGIIDSQGTVGDNNQQCKQPRMGSLDQDITILVTHYVNNEEEEEDNEEESYLYFTEPDMAKIDETEEEGEYSSNVKKQAGKETISTETNDGVEEDISSTNNQHNKTEDSSDPADQQSKTCKEVDNSEKKENKCEELRDVSVTKPLVPESPAPFGCHNIRTQVSLEVVQCQSAATSPMTPPEGDHAFCFPSSLGKCTSVGTEMKDAEMQAVEFRSVATAPMTPRTPTTMTFPEVRKEKSIEEKIVEEEEEAEEQDHEKKDEVVEEKEKITEEKKVEAAEQDPKNEETSCQENEEEKCEEPVQEVSWDEKGMTWEVYGAVVEVAVLGSAIQKHLEKQVKKQKMQATLPPPPPLNPSATPLTAEPIQRGSGSGKGREGKRGEKEGKVARRRRNPFRQLMENMQQPNCCSRAHTTE